jgi:plastocyanin
MRKLIASVLVLAALGIVASQAFAATRSVSVGDDWFVAKGHPRSITVKKGTTVTWHFRGKTMHNVDARKGPMHFISSYKKKGTFSKRLTKAGTYVVYCDIHSPDMRMTIHVKR